MSLDTLMSSEFIRFYLVFIHILASTIAVGSIIFCYIEFLNLGYLSKQRVLHEHKIVYMSLLILICSGLSIVYIDSGIITSFDQLFSYQKLTAKLLDVTLLILNGLLIHQLILPKILSSEVLSRGVTLLFGASAGASLACWINAIFLGKAKILVKIMDLKSFIIMDLTVVFVGTVFGVIISNFIHVKIQD